MKNQKNSKSQKNKNESKGEKFLSLLDNNRKCIYGFIVGVLIAAIVTTIIWPDRIATLSDGTQPVAEINGEKITADVLYEDMKDHYSVSYLLNRVDNMLLEPKYEETAEMNTELEEIANKYYTQATQYGYTKEQYLQNQGFNSHSEFIEALRLNYRRNKYYEEYVKSLVTEDEINKYYEENVYGDINSKHLLVLVDDNRTEEEAEKIAKEIITKLNEGKTFDEVKEEYKDSTTYEELGYRAFNSNIQESYMNALRNLENDKYTTEPVKTTYGYHVIYRIDQKEKPALDEVKDAIIDELATTKKDADSNLYYKALINLREENKFTFYDTVLESKYNNYKDSFK